MYIYVHRYVRMCVCIYVKRYIYIYTCIFYLCVYIDTMDSDFIFRLPPAFSYAG